MLEIRESCAWDKKELCTDKTVGPSGGLLGHFLNGIVKQKSKYGKSEFIKIILSLNHVYGGYCL